MVISAKPTRMARHSAGGGRLAKREPEGGVRDAIVVVAAAAASEMGFVVMVVDVM